jgi:hypothetical protein
VKEGPGGSGLDREGRDFAPEWYHILESFLSEAGTGITPCRQGEKGNRLIVKTGMLEGEEGQQGIRK